MKNKRKIKQEDKNVISTKISLIGKVASKLGVNNKFHKYEQDYIKDDNRFFISPVDAKVVAMGDIKEDGVIISKSNKEISLKEVVGEDAKLFSGGFYLNLYLSPKNRHYWRIPYDSELKSMKLNEGKAFLAVFIGLEKIFKNKDYFKKAIKKNANVGMIFKTPSFMYSMIPVGSLNVNGINIINDNDSKYKKGDLGGYFSIGSSMLICFPKGNFEVILNKGDNVTIGQNIIKII
jgi:phosphatidylserine decarboxylase